MARNTFNYEGQVHHVTPVQAFGANGFKKCELVCFTINTWKGKDYTDYALFEVKRDLADAVQKFKTNDKVRVSFCLAARSWQKESSSPVKWFGSAEAFKVEGDAPQGELALGTPDTAAPEGEPHGTVQYDEVADDMPF